MTNNVKLIFILMLLGILIPASLAVTEDTFVFPMTNLKSVYQIDYGNTTVENVRLNSYTISTSVDLSGVQSWDILASNDGISWALIDRQVNVSFVTNTPSSFSIAIPAVYRYYELYIRNGFYTVAQNITLKLTTDSTPVVWTPPVLVPGLHTVVHDTFFLTMTDTRLLHTINYGTSAVNITLLSYTVLSNVNLLTPVQSWDIFGSNDGAGWSLIDSETNIALSQSVTYPYTISNPRPYQYYMIYLNGGFWNIGKIGMFVFTTDQNGGETPITPTPTPTTTPTPTPTGTWTTTPTPTPFPTQIEVGNQTIRLSAEIGETYIKWVWTSVDGNIVAPVNVYINDTNIPTEMKYNQNSYLVTGLLPGEKHTIALYSTNGTQLIGRATATTIAQSELIYIMLGLCFVIMIVAILIKDLSKFLLVSIFNIILSIFGATLSSGHGMLTYVFFGVAIITGIVLLIQGIPKLREEIDWL